MKIEITDVEKKYPKGFKLAVDKIEASDNEILGIIGNNGAGKTTLLKLMLDLLLPDKGSILFNNINVAKSDKWKKYAGAFLDTGYIIPFLTPEEYFYFIGKLHHISKNEVDRIVSNYNNFFNNEILNQRGKLIRNFSIGNKTKIGIISTFIFNPKLLVFDEPFNGLDPTSQMILIKILLEKVNEGSTTIIISSHNLELVTQICSRFLIIESGRIVSDLKNNNDSRAKLKFYFSTQINK